MNTKNIVIIIVIIALVGIGVWALLGGKGAERDIIPPTEEVVTPEEEEEEEETAAELSLTDVLGRAKDIVSYWYDLVITSPEQTTIEAKVWLKGDKTKWEGKYEEQDVAILVDNSKQTAHVYIPAQNLALKMDFNQTQGWVGESPDEQSESIAEYNPLILGTEVLDGKKCLIVEYTVEEVKTKSWIWEKYGIPIRIESITDRGTHLVEVKNINVGDVSDSVFELPSGVRIMEMPSF